MIKYEFSHQVTNVIEQMDGDTSRHVFSSIMALPEFGEIKELEGRHAGQYRLRAGDWRVIFMLEDDRVLAGYVLAPREADGGAGQSPAKAAGAHAETKARGEAAAGKAAELHKMIDLLDDNQLDVLYNVASSFIAQMDPSYTARRDFDYISPEESEAIENAFGEIRRGECMTYVPEDDMQEFMEEK